MTTEDAETFPAQQAHTSSLNRNTLSAAAHGLAEQWAEFPPDHFDAMISAAASQAALLSQETVLRMRLDHEAKMARLRIEAEITNRQAEAEKERTARENQLAIERLRHRRHLVNVSAGALISIALLAAGVLVADTAIWLSLLLCGPSLLALAKVYVLSRSDPDDMKVVGRGTQSATNAATNAQPPPL
ncbi:hypothetical protein AB0937_33570 [Streptomyces sp. NPDC047880]|uniref:hypothetical protein n=1 Tax=Streptomyces sp. NPDC047880 TaxID=3155626 RepID=UPI003453580C